MLRKNVRKNPKKKTTPKFFRSFIISVTAFLLLLLIFAAFFLYPRSFGKKKSFVSQESSTEKQEEEKIEIGSDLSLENYYLYDPSLLYESDRRSLDDPLRQNHIASESEIFKKHLLKYKPLERDDDIYQQSIKNLLKLEDRQYPPPISP